MSMIYTPSLRSRMRAQELVVGMSINIASPQIVELAAIAGFDFASFDAEHGPLDMRDITNMATAADARGLPTIARPPVIDAPTILRILDAGVGGIMVPQLLDESTARAAVDAAKYAPVGRRGLGIVRANDWFFEESEAYISRANAEIVVSGLVESATAVDQIDEILAVEEIDAIWLGPSDLAMSMGLGTDTANPDVEAAIVGVVEKVKAAGRSAAVGVGNAADLERRKQQGFNVFVIQARTLLGAGGREFLASVR